MKEQSDTVLSTLVGLFVKIFVILEYFSNKMYFLSRLTFPIGRQIVFQGGLFYYSSKFFTATICSVTIIRTS